MPIGDGNLMTSKRLQQVQQSIIENATRAERFARKLSPWRPLRKDIVDIIDSADCIRVQFSNNTHVTISANLVERVETGKDHSITTRLHGDAIREHYKFLRQRLERMPAQSIGEGIRHITVTQLASKTVENEIERLSKAIKQNPATFLLRGPRVNGFTSA